MKISTKNRHFAESRFLGMRQSAIIFYEPSVLFPGHLLFYFGHGTSDNFFMEQTSAFHGIIVVSLTCAVVMLWIG